jgi:hypothetical protein
MTSKWKNKWFWFTFTFLTVFTLSVVSWALIFSPLRFEPKILGHFETEMNGSKQNNQVWVNDGNLKNLEKTIVRDWTGSGWKPMAQGMDFAPSLLGIGKTSEVLSPYIQMRVFQKNDTLRTLSLMQDPLGDRTYGWVSETPKDILDLEKARAHWDFPFTPPKYAQLLICQKNPKFQLAFIFLPTNRDLSKAFNQICLAQGFQIKPFQDTPDHWGYLLSRGSVRLLAILDATEKEDRISLVRFSKN